MQETDGESPPEGAQGSEGACEAHRERYRAAMHAMQSGVAFLEGKTPEASPKHLRVGVNSALIDSGALAFLLIEKGVFTECEYYSTLADIAEAEAETYRELVQKVAGMNVTLA